MYRAHDSVFNGTDLQPVAPTFPWIVAFGSSQGILHGRIRAMLVPREVLA